MKKTFNVIVCFVLIISLALPVYASARYRHIDTLFADLDMDEFWGVANCSGTVVTTGDLPAKVEVRLRMNKGGQWETLKTWTDSGSGMVGAGGRYAVARGYEYQVYVTAYVYDEAGTLIDSGSLTYNKYLS